MEGDALTEVVGVARTNGQGQRCGWSHIVGGARVGDTVLEISGLEKGQQSDGQGRRSGDDVASSPNPSSTSRNSGNYEEEATSWERTTCGAAQGCFRIMARECAGGKKKRRNWGGGAARLHLECPNLIQQLPVDLCICPQIGSCALDMLPNIKAYQCTT